MMIKKLLAAAYIESAVKLLESENCSVDIDSLQIVVDDIKDIVLTELNGKVNDLNSLSKVIKQIE